MQPATRNWQGNTDILYPTVTPDRVRSVRDREGESGRVLHGHKLGTGRLRTGEERTVRCELSFQFSTLIFSVFVLGVFDQKSMITGLNPDYRNPYFRRRNHRSTRIG